MKMAVFWVVAPCSLVVLMMEAVSISETSVNFHHGATTQKTAIFIFVVICMRNGKYPIFDVLKRNSGVGLSSLYRTQLE
jgi:hypothetical protein